MDGSLDGCTPRERDAIQGSLIDARGVAVGYGKEILVKDICFEVRPGQITVMIGPNGTGKSTLLRTIIRQLTPMEGMIFLDGKSLGKVPEKEVSRTMAILMTERVSPEMMTCRDVAAAGRYPYTGRFGLLSEEDLRQIDRAMDLVGVKELAECAFARVSDGQRQRVMLARAICQQPRLLVLDEPTSYLDIRYKLEFLTTLRTLARENKTAVLLTLHELELAKSIADQILCVKNGIIDRMGRPEEIFSGGYIRRLYDAENDGYSEIYGFLDSPTEGESGRGVHVLRSGTKRLRCGFTTGTCAALAAAGAARLLLGRDTDGTVGLITPKGLRVETVPVFTRKLSETKARCGIRKDAGDDPDITDGIIVIADVELTESEVTIDKGPGVGRVTKPGLDQPVGAAAINRVPRQMIEEQVRMVMAEAGYQGGVRVVISIPGGEELAERTFNPRIGVEGGLSILGTSGIVEPMSEQALLDTIGIMLRQACVEGKGRAILTPGNYGETFLKENGYENLGVPVVKYSNYVGDTLDMVSELDFLDILLVGHIGKLVKLAGGIMNTHSGMADCRMELFCAYAAVCGADTELCRRLLDAVSTDGCLALLKEAGLAEPVLACLLEKMQQYVERRVNGACRAGIVVFSNEYGMLGKTGPAEEILTDWAMAGVRREI